MKVKLFFITLLSILVIHSSAQSSSVTVRELMTKSGSTKMFQQLEGMMAAKVAEQKTKFTNPEDFAKFESAMRAGLNSQKAEAYFVHYFEKYTSEDSLKAVIEMYNDPLMKEMAKLEEDINTPAKQQEMQTYLAGFNTNPPSAERLQLLVTLNNAIGGSEMLLKLFKSMMMSMVKAVNQSQPKEKQVSDTELEKNLMNALPPNLEQLLTNQIVAISLFTYKDVDSTKLNTYIQKWQMPVGQYFVKSTISALDFTFTKMGEDLGTSIGTSFK